MLSYSLLFCTTFVICFLDSISINSAISPVPTRSKNPFRECADKLEPDIDLTKKIEVIEETLNNLNSDVAWIKENMLHIANASGVLSLKQPSSSISTDTLEEVSKYPKNCKEIQDEGNSESGVYVIQPHLSTDPFMVVCDMDTRGGGWTHIHNRYDGKQNFNVSWNDYKLGFGNLAAEFWLGLDHIYALTGQEVNELLVELVDVLGKKAYAHFAAFSIGSEATNYELKLLGGYSGDAGDSLSNHAGSMFSTKDFDQDQWDSGNCAETYGGGWWYTKCYSTNLNGIYFIGPIPKHEADMYNFGMHWKKFSGYKYSLSKARMMVRPRGPNTPSIFPKGLSLSTND